MLTRLYEILDYLNMAFHISCSCETQKQLRGMKMLHATALSISYPDIHTRTVASSSSVTRRLLAEISIDSQIEISHITHIGFICC